MSIDKLESTLWREEEKGIRKMISPWEQANHNAPRRISDELFDMKPARHLGQNEENASNGRIHATLNDEVSINIAEDVRNVTIVFRIVDVDSEEVLVHPTTDRKLIDKYLNELDEEEKQWIKLETARAIL